MMNYTKRLRELREKNQLTLKAVADYLGTTEDEFAEYEKDANHMPNRYWGKLSALYHVSVDYMLCLTENPKHA